MRDRLIELIQESVNGCAKNWAEVIADHLLANGIVVPSVSVGQTVYIIDEGDEGTEPYVLEVKVAEIGYDVSGFWIEMKLPLGLKQSAYVVEDSFGKTVFLSQEEAEQKLKEGKG